MEQKDMSEIIEILRTNGVGFIKCHFRSSVYMDSTHEHYNRTSIPWRLDFSDGIKYLGSLDTMTGVVDGVTEKDHGHWKSAKYITIYLGRIFGCPSGLGIELNFNRSLIGKCIIYCESTELSW